jgi:GTP-binding protein HflX
VNVISISGNLESLKKSVIFSLEQIYEINIPEDSFLPEELAVRISRLTEETNREIAVYLDRKGRVVDICVGDSSTVALLEVEGRRSRSRLPGIRCIHTHPNGSGRLSDIDINALTALRLDAMIAVGVRNGKPAEVYAALPPESEYTETGGAEIFGPYTADSEELNALIELVKERDKKPAGSFENLGRDRERCILVGLDVSIYDTVSGKTEGERSLDELAELADTAGAVVVHKVLQRRTSKDSAYYIGRGKVEELSLMRQALNADTIIFDHELSGAQIRNIEEAVGAKVIDRTMLILDIFAQRARSREGKLQVELAQMKYMLPRLVGAGNRLSRLGGGIGTRGPGEKELEVDRRHIRRRIKSIKSELEDIRKRRSLVRTGREKNALPAFALVGYTNAGKSTLMNYLCKADVFAEDRLFATLDPTTRKLALEEGKSILLIDTVGFIRKLPHELIDAFKSTLEEVIYADALIHVADVSDEELDEHIKVVKNILRDIGAGDKPTLLALNKADLVKGEIIRPPAYEEQNVYEISAVTGEGIEKLIEGINKLAASEESEYRLLVPYNEGKLISYIHQNGKVLEENFTEKGTEIRAVLNGRKAEKLRGYLI